MMIFRLLPARWRRAACRRARRPIRRVDSRPHIALQVAFDISRRRRAAAEPLAASADTTSRRHRASAPADTVKRISSTYCLPATSAAAEAPADTTCRAPCARLEVPPRFTGDQA